MSASLPHIAQDPEVDPRNPHHMKVGTLSYTMAGLITLFLFLLWGDFSFSLMETVVPVILPLKLNAIGASNKALGLIVTVIPNVMNLFINPIASFRSDRFRSRWGRRIPFLAGVTPFLVLFLILLGYSEPIGKMIHGTIFGHKFSETTVLLWTIGVFMVCFQFFNLFITSIYYYLFNDVVPHAFLARFMALFRVVGGGAGSLFNYAVLKYAKTHMQEIFLWAALLYFVAFIVMCLFVKEGEYPPPPPNVDNKSGLIPSLKTYAVECYSHQFYWFLFLANSFIAMTWASGSFGTLLSTNYMGYSLDFIGKLGGICGIISMVLLYPAGIIADRFHPLRVQITAATLQLMIAPFSIAFTFMRPHFALQTAMHISIFFSALSLPIGTLGAAAELPVLMKLFPQERYGQFCSANALIRSLALIVAGFFCGGFLDFMKTFNPNPDYCYRFVPVWNVFFNFCSLFFLYKLYRAWKWRGGMQGYVPPQVEPAGASPVLPA